MRWDAPFTATYVPARAFLLRRGLYALLALDAWLVMIEHGGRYGAGGFNVAHFGWLDLLLPLPSPGLYVGLLVGTGLAALAMTFFRASTASKFALALVYTLGWALSLHDSYQHHYLLSWLLLWMAVLPEESPEQLRGKDLVPVPGTGLSLTAFTCAIVYAFTGISKTSAEWRSGAVLMRLSHSQPPGAVRPGILDPVRDLLMAWFGIGPETAFHWLAVSVIALQWVVAFGFAAAPGRDSAPSKWRAWLCSLGWAGAWSFHLTAELTHMFEIGWFSYYMLWISFVLLAPPRWVSGVGKLLSALSVPVSRPSSARLLAVELLFLSSMLVWAATLIDLPGAFSACMVVLMLGLWSSLAAWRSEDGSAVQTRVVAGVMAASALALCIGGSSVRFDFYRRWAGEIARLGQLEQALALYRKAERYAPPGHSRARQIHDLERRLSPPQQR